MEGMLGLLQRNIDGEKLDEFSLQKLDKWCKQIGWGTLLSALVLV